MYASFRRHVYPRHSHETYSFGVTEVGAQAFLCRGGARVSAAGMVMAFNPDDLHDGHAADGRGFTYRMLHVDPETVTRVLREALGVDRLPLFPDPVVDDQRLAVALRSLHEALVHGSALERGERIMATVLAMSGMAATAATASPLAAMKAPLRDHTRAERMRSMLRDAWDQNVSAADVAGVAGCSRYAAWRSFRAAFGLAPSEYQRLLRLRAARRMLAAGGRPGLADVAFRAGFADQAHLTRWFVRTFGVTPRAYRDAAG